MRFAERTSRKLARSIFMAMSRWQAKLERKQAVLGRLVDIGAELFAISATVGLRDHGRARAARAGGVGRRARRPVLPAVPPADRRAVRCLWANDDDQAYGLAQQTLKGRYTWLEEGIIDPSGAGPMIAGQPESVAAGST